MPEPIDKDPYPTLEQTTPEASSVPADGASLPPAAPGDHDLGSLPETIPHVSPDSDKPLVAGYQILEVLGRGGMGVVYKALQVGLNRIVAVKMLLSGEHAEAHELARFRVEAEAVARLHHPNIVQIYEVREENGRPFFSLEFVEGGSLAAKRTPVPSAPAAQLVETLSRTIHVAHKCGIIHRDLKPANVLLTADGVPKITDFGLAKRLDQSLGQTQSGAIVGTASYMAPEQAAGKTKEIGPATDVYALGAILYELLTGRPPFRAATAWETMLQVISEPPVPPCHLQTTVPRDLETICMKCLQKEPNQRYTSADGLADDLRRFLAGEPIKARRVSLRERVAKWARRRPAAALLTAMSFFIYIPVLAWGFVYVLVAMFSTTYQGGAVRKQLIVTATEKNMVKTEAKENQGGGSGDDSNDIVIGMSAAFTGPSRGLSIELYRGSMAYFEHINRTERIHGRKIVIKAYDDGYDPLPAIKNTIVLVERDKVFLLYGYMGTPTTTRMLPLLKRYRSQGRHIYLFFPFTGAEPERQPPYDEFVFNLRASFGQETAGLVERFVKIGRKRIAVFYQIDAYGRSGWDGVRRKLAEHDLGMVDEAKYRRGTKFSESLHEQVAVLRKANPDVVISVGTYSTSAAFIRDARDAGWQVPIANVSGVDSANLLALLRDTGAANSKDYTANLINSEVVPSFQDETLAAVKQYRKFMTQYKPAPPSELLNEPYQPPRFSYISFEGFLNAKLLVAMLKKMGPNLQRERIKQVMESVQDFDLGIDVPVSFRADKHQGFAADQVYYTKVLGDRFVPLREEEWKRWAQ